MTVYRTSLQKLEQVQAREREATALLKEFQKVLTGLLKHKPVVPSCHQFHHSSRKGDLHESSQECPPLKRWNDAVREAERLQEKIKNLLG